MSRFDLTFNRNICFQRFSGFPTKMKGNTKQHQKEICLFGKQFLKFNERITFMVQKARKRYLCCLCLYYKHKLYIFRICNCTEKFHILSFNLFLESNDTLIISFLRITRDSFCESKNS